MHDDSQSIGSEAVISLADDSPAHSDAGGGQMAAARIAWQAPNGTSGVITLGQDGRPSGERLPEAAVAGRTSATKAGDGEFSVTVTFTGDGTAGPAASPFDYRAAELYLDLMKKCLTRMVFNESGPPVDPQYDQYDPTARQEGRDWPADAETMVGMLRLDNVQHCVVDVLRRGVPGDLIETGVWRGGTSIFMRAILEAYGDRERQVWVADSFKGLPKPNAEQYPADAGLDLSLFPQLSISLEKVKANFERYGLLDERVCFLEGWFKDTLPGAPIERLALMRLDGDLYESTMDALRTLYPKLSVGGYVIIDDYNGIPACAQAVEDYRAQQEITEPIQRIDWTGVYWKREQPQVAQSSEYLDERLGGQSVSLGSIERNPGESNSRAAHESVISKFHELYYDSADQTWKNTYWFGTQILKCAFDLWIYQEIIHETRPELIVETGSMEGGSALFMAMIMDLLGQGQIVSIDIEDKPWRPMHPRITYLHGSSTDPRVLARVTEIARGSRSVMVILDSDHSAVHVAEELRHLSPLVTSGNYLIVEDTNVNGNPVFPIFGPGPKEALDSFLAGNTEFYVDHTREKYFLTFNPGGYLRRR